MKVNSLRELRAWQRVAPYNSTWLISILFRRIFTQTSAAEPLLQHQMFAGKCVDRKFSSENQFPYSLMARGKLWFLWVSIFTVKEFSKGSGMHTPCLCLHTLCYTLKPLYLDLQFMIICFNSELPSCTRPSLTPVLMNEKRKTCCAYFVPRLPHVCTITG